MEEDPFVPEVVLRRVFDLINQCRSQYGMHPLIFSKELSFLAGEHACKMSTKKVPYGHSDFKKRIEKAPLALTFTENIACVKPNKDDEKESDPGRLIIMSWFNRSSAFSRILGEYTHTGIGVSENEEGLWYCTQAFATFKPRLYKKDALILVSRFINFNRIKRKLNPLVVSLTTAINMLKFSEKYPLNTLSISSAKSMFDNCYEIEEFVENVPKSNASPVETFINTFKENKAKMKITLNEFTHISFMIQPSTETSYTAVLLLARCRMVFKRIPKMYIAYPVACQMQQLINDYRVAKGEKPIIMSLQWCEIAQRNSTKMMEHKKEIETRSVSKRIAKLFPTSKAHVGVLVTNWSIDPIQEIFLLWISSQSTRSILLSSKFNALGFGMAAFEQKSLYITRIIGYKDIDMSKVNEEAYSQKDRKPFVLDGMSSDDDDYDIPVKDAAASFTLTK